MLKISKLTLLKLRGVIDTLGHRFFGSLSLRRISDRENPPDSYPQIPTSETPATTSTSASSTSTSVPASISHITPPSFGCSRTPAGCFSALSLSLSLSLPLSLSPKVFCLGASRRKRKTAA